MKKMILTILALLVFPLFANANSVGEVLFDENGNVPIGSSIAQQVAQNVVHVRSMADFPAPAAGVITLAANTQYIIDAPLTTADRFVIPTGSVNSLIGSFSSINTITYTGAGNFISSTNPALIELLSLTIINSGSGTFLSGTGNAGSILIANEVSLTGWASLGSLTSYGFVDFTRFVARDVGDGFTFDDGYNFNVFNFSGQNTVDSNNPFITIQGANNVIKAGISTSGPNTQTNESFLYIDSNIPSTASIVIQNCDDSGTGSFFAAGSLDETDVRVEARGNIGQKDSARKAEMFLIVNAANTLIATTGVPVKASGTWAQGKLERFAFDPSGRLTHIGREPVSRLVLLNFRGQNATGTNKPFAFYFSEGNDTLNTITAFADSAAAPGVDTTVTTTNPHGLLAGARVPITNTTNYNLVHTITRIVDANNFDINTAFVADDATGNWAFIIENSITSNNFSLNDNKNNTVVANVEFDTDDYVELFVQNNLDTSNFAVDQAKFIIGAE